MSFSAQGTVSAYIIESVATVFGYTDDTPALHQYIFVLFCLFVIAVSIVAYFAPPTKTKKTHVV